MKLLQKVLITATTSTQHTPNTKLCLAAAVMMIACRRETKKQPTICQLHCNIRERVYNPFWLPR